MDLVVVGVRSYLCVVDGIEDLCEFVFKMNAASELGFVLQL